MDAQQFFLEIFSFSLSLFSLVIGVIAVQLLIFILSAKTLEDSSNPHAEGSAIFSYIMLTIGTVLMSISAIPATVSIMGGTAEFTPDIYIGLVLIFAAGGLLYLWNDHRLQKIDEKAKKVPHVIFFYAVKGVGQLSLVLSGLFVTLSIVLQQEATGGFWGVPITLFLYGSVLCILTKEEQQKRFHLLPIKKKGGRKKK